MPDTPRPVPAPPATLTARHVARLAWQAARRNGETDRAEVARRRIDHLLDQLNTKEDQKP